MTANYESTSRSNLFRNVVDAEDAIRYRTAGWWSDQTVGAAVRKHAKEQPGRKAYVTGNLELSYSELDVAADLIAGTLADMGGQPGDRLAVLLPDGPSVHAVFIGAERAGMPVVGIGARSGEQEIGHILQKTGANRLVTQQELRGRNQADLVRTMRNSGLVIDQHIVVPELGSGTTGPLLINGVPTSSRSLSSVEEAERHIGADDLFLINSTSGTTGVPKCVVHFQNRWFYFHQKAVANGHLTESDVFFGAVPAPFGFGLWTSHTTPLLLGATTVNSERFDASSTLELIERERVTVLCCVSTQFIMMVNCPDFPRRDLSSLRVMFTGGESVPFEQALRFETVTGAQVLQFYGSNETGLLSGTYYGEPMERRLGTAGQIAPEMNVRLFEEDSDVTKTGRGQPACRGPATGIGYLDDVVGNSQLFTSDGWMLMADICTLDSEGYLSVVGRASDIIIRGGKNISAAQVESEVAAHPDVVLAAAVPVEDPVFGERVCVYVELLPGASLGLPELSAFLSDRGISKEIIPEYLIVLDQLPISVGGKVAKASLRDDAKQLSGQP